MNNYENPYIRLQTYYSWISRGSYDLDGMSILELHHYTQIPIDTIRQDIAAMLKWQAAIDSKYDGNISFIPENLENRIFLDPENIKDLFKENQSDDITIILLKPQAMMIASLKISLTVLIQL